MNRRLASAYDGVVQDSTEDIIFVINYNMNVSFPRHGLAVIFSLGQSLTDQKITLWSVSVGLKINNRS